MSSAPKAKPLQQVVLPPQRASIGAAVEECLERTATLLLQAGAASKQDLINAITIARQSHARGVPADLLETLCIAQGHTEEQLPAIIQSFSDKISITLTPSPPMIPFAGKLITPSAFYEAFPDLRQLGAALLGPVIYAEDSDAIGTAALNPVAATIMAEEIMAAVARRYNIRPFVTAVVLDYASWTTITRKHFQR